MKNFLGVFLIYFLLIPVVNAQQEEEIIKQNGWLNLWTDFKPNLAEIDEPSEILTGEITEDRTLNKRDTYILVGNVFVNEGVTLTIEPGTVIIGDYETKASLTIAKGANLIAEGLETDPIVFTSNRSIKKAGDWAGIVILGDGALNKFGIASASSLYKELEPKFYQKTNYGGGGTITSSGILKYVRIEYAGQKEYSLGTSLSGLLLAGVGNETIIENVMVSYSAGDSFQVLGGEVNLKNLISYRSSGNDFTFNLGTQAQLSNSIAIRNPYTSNSLGARCLNVRSYYKKAEVDFSKKRTSLVAENLKLINSSKDLEFDMQSGLVKEGVYIGHYTLVNIDKSEILGFKPAIVFNDKIQTNQETLNKIGVTNTHFKSCLGNVSSIYSSKNGTLDNWYSKKEYANMISGKNSSKILIADAKKAEADNKIARSKSVINKNIAMPIDLIEKAPVPPGCERNAKSKECFKKKIRSHIAANFRYPEEALRNNIEGRVLVVFEIDANGNIVNVRSRGPNKTLTDEAERIIKLLPKMQPAKKQGQTVKMSYGVPIAFNKL